MVELLAPEIETSSPQCRDALSRAQHHLTLGEYAQAVAASTQAIECCPGDRLGYVYRASAYELMGDSRRAQSDYQAAHRLAE